MRHASIFATAAAAVSLTFTQAEPANAEMLVLSASEAKLKNYIKEGCPGNSKERKEDPLVVENCLSTLLEASDAMKDSFIGSIEKRMNDMSPADRQEAQYFVQSFQHCAKKIWVAAPVKGEALEDYGDRVYDAVKTCTNIINDGKREVGIAFAPDANMFLRVTAASLLDPTPMSQKEWERKTGESWDNMEGLQKVELGLRIT